MSSERPLGTSDGAGARLPAKDRPAEPGWRPDGDLSPLEQEMVAGAAAGELVDRGAGPFNLAEMQAWGEERTVRAAVLRHLLVAGSWPVHAKGVRLRGARISGHLDLEAATLRCPLSLECCYLDADDPARLDHATASRVTLTGCELAGLTGEMLTARELDLSGSTLTGPLVLPNADIAGGLLCSGARLTGTGSSGYALDASGIKAGGVILDVGFTAAGAVCLVGADIAEGLLCSGARLTGTGSSGYALDATGIKAGGVILDDGFTAGAICLENAEIRGSLGCDGAWLTGRDSDGYALSAAAIKVDGSVSLGGEFTAAGPIQLTGANITRGLVCLGARLTGRDKDGYALSAGGIKARSGVYLCEGFTAVGAIQLEVADIAGGLFCSGARLTGRDKDGYALSAAGIKVDGDVFLNDGFTAGAVCLTRADIAGTLNCDGAHLTRRDKDGRALDATLIKCENVFLGEGFTADRTISLISARLSGLLSVTPTRLAGNEEDADQAEEVSLDASHAQITGVLHWRPAEQIRGQVNLRSAAVGELIDDWSDERADANGYWPSDGRLKLDGFTYDRFGGDRQATVKQRLAWIQSQYWRSDTGWRGYATQPYEQLATVYRQAGQDTQARKVAIAKRAHLRKYGNLNRYRWFGNWFQDKTIKYGYQVWRTAAGLAALFVAFLALSIVGQQQHMIVPTGDITGLHPVPSATQCTGNYPCFYPAGYAVDTVIPIINVHQASYWGPDGHAPWGWIWVSLTWVATGLGWALVTLLVVGYTGLVRQDLKQS